MHSLLPLFPLRSVLLPQASLELRFFEPRYRALLERCKKDNLPFGVVFSSQEGQWGEDCGGVGCSARIIDDVPLKDGSRRVTVLGEKRFACQSVEKHAEGYDMAHVVWLEDEQDVTEKAPLMQSAAKLAHIYEALLASIDPDMVRLHLEEQLGPEDLYRILHAMILPDEKRQKALEIASQKERLELTLHYLQAEIQNLRFLLAEPDAMGMASTH